MPAVMAVAGSLSDNEADCLEERVRGIALAASTRRRHRRAWWNMSVADHRPRTGGGRATVATTHAYRDADQTADG